jgi:hypothetical protein
MRSLLLFETMVTPRIITFVYWLLLLGSGVSGLAAMLGDGRPSLSGFAIGLGIFVGGSVAARVGCELMVVLFRIDEHLRAVAQRL